ncbi:DeoR/GlpR family DNA-binding transcription regulator [Photobacterium profundum]|uniref:DeoR/GlpR family DNA-binding transcription regulator n=1 Tax=Photobacterium profundum TaxID=74109 RepID=UPI003D14EE5F
MPSHNQTLKHQESIHCLLNERSSLSIQEISEMLHVSSSTVRRNVAAMVTMYPNIKRTHGGVSINAFVSNRNQRSDLVSPSLIARAAHKVKNGQTIYLDSGKTALSLAKVLCHMNINIITIDMNIAFFLKDYNQCQTTLIGGVVSNNCEFTTGNVTLNQLEHYIFDIAFISTNCFDLVHGVTAPHAINAKTKQLVMNNTNENYLIAEGSKFNKFSFYPVADLIDFEGVITDHSIPKKTIDMLVSNGVLIV